VQSHLDQNLADESHSIYIAADEDGAFLGYCAVHWLPYLFLSAPEGYISELFILEQGRGQGLGGRLLEAVEEEARSRGCSRLQLINGRDRESYRRGFYTKHGYEERDMAPFLKRLSA
jgi:GNAT superfamily N-acetyltransferase